MGYCDPVFAGPNSTLPWQYPTAVRTPAVHARRQALKIYSFRIGYGVCAAAPLWPAQRLCQPKEGRCQQRRGRGDRGITLCQATAILSNVQLRQPGTNLDQVCHQLAMNDDTRESAATEVACAFIDITIARSTGSMCTSSISEVLYP